MLSEMGTDAHLTLDLVLEPALQFVGGVEGVAIVGHLSHHHVNHFNCFVHLK
jgi:hypothetical protein